MNSELQNLFNQAVEAQSQGKDIEALGLYQEISKQGFSSPALELNRALLFEKQENWGRALTSLEKAQFLSRNPWLAQERFERIQRQIGSNRAYSTGSLGELSDEFSKIIRPAESLFLASLLIGAFLIVRALGYRHRAFMSFLVFAMIFLSFSGIALGTDKARYLLKDTEIRSVPLAEAATSLNVGKGAKVIVRREKANFLEIERPGDFEGWIPKDTFSQE